MQTAQIEIVGEGPCLPDSIICLVCGESATFDERAKVLYQVTVELTLALIFAGWTCTSCYESFPPSDVVEQINKSVVSRLVALGLRPKTNPATVRRMLEEQADRRATFRSA